MKFAPVREVLDEVVPADVAPVGLALFGIDPSPSGADVDMSVYKGIVAGVLSGVSASEVFYVSSEDMGDDLMDWDFDATEYELSGAHNSELNSVDFAELPFPTQVAACYWDAIAPDETSRIDLSTDGYGFVVTTKTYNWPDNDQEIGYLITTCIEAEGGPPTDHFFVRKPRGA